MSSPNALRDTLEEDEAGELQTTTDLRVSVPRQRVAEEARQPQQGQERRGLHRRGETVKETLGSRMKRAGPLGCVCCVQDFY